MANSVYTPVLQVLMAKFMLRLRNQALASRVVDRDLDNAPSGIGNTINVTYPTTYTAQAITPGYQPQDGQAATPSTVPLTLSNWYEVPIKITDQDLGNIQAPVWDAEVDSASTGLVEAVNASIYAETDAFYNVAGTAGTNPFATDESPLLTALQYLDQGKAPASGRVAILNPAAKAKALKIDNLTRYDARGDGAAKMTGIIGNAYGADVMWDQLVNTHVSTPLTAGAATVNGVQTVAQGSTDNGRTGTISIAKLTNASNLVRGDILTFSGDAQTYVVQANITLAVGNTTVSIAPALTTAKAGGESVTLTATHVTNPVMFSKAISFASRPVASLEGVGHIYTQVDPVTGLALTIELSRQYFQTRMSFSCLWGVKSFRPEWGARMLG